MSANQHPLVAVIGAGPYGLSVAAALRALDVPTHVFGEPLEYWRKQMPEGMHLKSSWRASSIASPNDELSLPGYERARGMPLERPIPIADFIEYGMWYQRAAVPDLDSRRVSRVEQGLDGFTLRLSDGEQLVAGRVVLATGLHEFSAIPAQFDALAPGLVSHTSGHRQLDVFKGQRLCVIGAGQSAIECAVLASEAGADVEVVVRAPAVHWLTRKAAIDRGLGRRLYAPSDVGPAGVSWVVSAPGLVRRLPLETRRRMVRRSLRPAATAWLLPRADAIKFTCGRRVIGVTTRSGGSVELTLDDGQRLETDHVLLGTGFRPDLGSVSILAPELREAVRQRDGYPALRPGFETSVPGLHAVGSLAADSFGPLMRFVAGTWYTAPCLARHLAEQAQIIARRSRALHPSVAAP